MPLVDSEARNEVVMLRSSASLPFVGQVTFGLHQFETRAISKKGPNEVFAFTMKGLAFGKA